MKVSSVIALLFLLFPSPVDAIFFGIFGFIWDYFVGTACSRVQNALSLNDDNTVSCTCRGNFGILTGLTADLDCQSDDRVCLSPSETRVCGTPTIGVDLSASFFSGSSSFRSDITSCILFDDIFGDDAGICMQGTPSSDGKLESCKMIVNGEDCTECEVCDDKLSFTFDCQNVNLGAAQDSFFSGPYSDFCFGLNFQNQTGVV